MQNTAEYSEYLNVVFFKSLLVRRHLIFYIMKRKEFSHIKYSQQKQNKILDKLGGGRLRKLNTQRFKKFNRREDTKQRHTQDAQEGNIGTKPPSPLDQ